MAVDVAQLEDSTTRTIRSSALLYLKLTKPRIIELLLVTAVPPMILAEGGFPGVGLVLAVVIGGALAAGGANTVNCWIDRDRDRLMARTSARPLPAGEVEPARALAFGIALNVVAFAILWPGANLLAACLTLAATLYYVFVYSIWLKPRTDQNIVIGGAAGAIPAMVGWVAVTGGLDVTAGVLFGMVFLWTPAHFWALALKYRDEYAGAGVPMLPVRRGADTAARQITAYASMTVVATLILAAVSDAGIFYAASAVILGAVFVGAAVRLVRDTSSTRAIRFFAFSNVYLTLVFASIAADTYLR